MKLSHWRKLDVARTQSWVGEQIGVDQTFISRIERAIEPRMPSREVMRSIYVLTGGAVQPNDFCDLPAWEADLIRNEAEAELARKAA